MPNDGNTSSASGEVKRKKNWNWPLLVPYFVENSNNAMHFPERYFPKEFAKKNPSKSDEK
jgi:hypothetical protein